MLNTICVELIKLRKNKMAIIGLLIVVAIPCFLITKSFLIDDQRGTYQNWLQTEVMLNSLVFPIISGFVITFLIHKEYQDRTIRNILTAPTSKNAFVIAKLVAWFCWYLITLIGVELVSLCAYRILFPLEFGVEGIKLSVKLLTCSSLLSFISFIPILAIAFWQKTLFYPAMLVTLCFTVLQMAGQQITEKMIPIASFVPWTAVSLVTLITPFTYYFFICLFSILLSGVIGILLGLYVFKNQEE